MNKTVQAEPVKKQITRLTGVVTSDKMEKTVVVTVSRRMRHPLYKKTVSTSKKYKAHNEMGAKYGDEVVIEETRPLSKDKRFIVTRILEKHHVMKAEDQDKSDLEILMEHGVEDKPNNEETEGAEA